MAISGLVMPRVMLSVAILGCLVHLAQGLGSGAKIPAPTNVYKEGGMNYFKGTTLRFSMTVSIRSIRDGTYWGTRYNDETEDYELHGDFPNRTRETLFEMVDAGTEDNTPVNTKTRPADYYDQRRQKFYVRFNETLILRAQSINRYVGITGVNFNSEPIFVDEIERAERIRVLPVFDFYTPDAYPIATNENQEDEATYVKNGTKVHLLNWQNNYAQKIENMPKVYVHGTGRAKRNMWRQSDRFQFVMLKLFEE